MHASEIVRDRAVDNRARAIAVVLGRLVARKNIDDDWLLRKQRTVPVMVTVGTLRTASDNGYGIAIAPLEQPNIDRGPKTLGGERGTIVSKLSGSIRCRSGDHSA